MQKSNKGAQKKKIKIKKKKYVAIIFASKICSPNSYTRCGLQVSVQLYNESYYGECVRQPVVKHSEHIDISPLTNRMVQLEKDSDF